MYKLISNDKACSSSSAFLKASSADRRVSFRVTEGLQLPELSVQRIRSG